MAEKSKLTNFVFEDINYSVNVAKCRCLPKKEKHILKGISGVFKPGLNAIFGPTGGGKTSLLDLLAKRRSVTKSEFSGRILINGAPLPDNFKLISGYVVQNDVIMGTLTVKENLMFAAHMRLGGISEEERIRKVDDTITELQLSKCANTKIGTDLIKGVSGGERKRCNIGMELIIQPEILFLDEPTTGLDSSTSLTILNLLKHIAERGNKIIIFSIHQPRYAIYRLIDRLHLLSRFGETVYHGPQEDALKHFASFGCACEPYNNPADFFLDTIINYSQPIIYTQEEEKVQLTKNLVQSFSDSEYNKILSDEISEIVTHSKNAGNERFSAKAESRNFFSQFYYLSSRSILNLCRDPKASIIPVVIMVIFAVAVSVLYMDTKNDLKGFQNKFGALFFITVQLLFGNLAALDVFISSRSLYLHELANGYYSIPAFFSSKILLDLLPLRAFPVLIFSTLVYFLLGLKKELFAFFIFIVNNITATMCACSLVFFIAINFGNYSIASSVCSMAFTSMILFAGLIVNVSSIPAALRFLKYFSIPRYSLATLTANELIGQEFCGSKVLFGNHSRYICQTGESLLELQDIDPSEESIWINIGLLSLLMSFYFLLSFTKLFFLKKDK